MTLLARFWYAPVILALLVWAAIAHANLDKCKAQRDAANTRLEVSNSSIDRLENDLGVILKAQQDLAAADRNRVDVTKERLALIEAAEKARQAAAQRLLQSAGQNNPSCDFSDTIKELWK